MVNNININSLQMGSFYDYELGNKKRIYLDIGEAALDYSLFTEYMLSKKMKVSKKNKTYDFVMCKFDYGTNDKTASEVRDYYYTTGFIIDWTKYEYKVNLHNLNLLDDSEIKTNKISKIKDRYKSNDKHNIVTYKMLMRSTGKAKDGDCLFVNEKLYDEAYYYITMGIKLPEENSRIVEMSAYQTLTSANMVHNNTPISISIPLKNILILKDQEIKTYVKTVNVNVKTDIGNIQIIDYKAMEQQANEKGYTFYKKNEFKDDGYDYIRKRSVSNLKSLEIDIIYKDYTDKSGNTKQTMDFDAMEQQARDKGYTFFKKEANKHDGYTLIDRDVLVAHELDIDIIVKDGKEVKVKECYVERPNELTEVTNIMWDGMGVCDSSIMEQLVHCSEFAYLRSHMFKACFFEGEVVQFLKDKYGDDYNTATKEDYFGNQINVRDILLITTDKAIKWLKFQDLMGNSLKEAYAYYDRFMEEFDYKFEVVKTAHPSKWGNLQRSSYQGNNSLPCLDEEDLKKIAEKSYSYANNLKDDDEKFIEYLHITSNKYNINNVLIGLYKHEPEIIKTKSFTTQRTKIISKFKKERLELGKLLQEGDNLTVAGNPYALLMYAVNEDWKQDPTLNVINDAVQCYTKRFKSGEYLAGYRNPMNSPNNYGYYKNYHHPLMEKYFPNLGRSVICVSMIKTSVQSRNNGLDMDTDALYCTNQPEIVKYSKICFEEYPTIVNNIKTVDDLTEDEKEEYKDSITKYSNTLLDFSRMDNDISRYQCGIGWSSNVAQLALSYYWDELHRTGKKNIELEDIFIISSVLAQCYIDSSKRTFTINLNQEMTRLSRYECMQKGKKYPKFYAKIKVEKTVAKKAFSEEKKVKKKEDLKKIEYNTIEECKCPMDMLAKIINENINDKTGTNKNGTLDISDFIYKKDDILGKKRANKDQLDKIELIIEEYDKNMKELNTADEDYKDKAIATTDKTMNKLNKLSISKETMYKLIRVAFGLDQSKISGLSNRILILMYNHNKKQFLSLFKKVDKKTLEVA